jgi:hypothetical protein
VSSEIVYVNLRKHSHECTNENIEVFKIIIVVLEKLDIETTTDKCFAKNIATNARIKIFVHSWQYPLYFF